MTKKILFSFAAMLVSLFCADSIDACSCYAPPPIYHAYEVADAVFIGKVVRSNLPKEEENHDDIIFNFEVIENFKGVKKGLLPVNAGSRSSSCYTGFGIEDTYLVYAYRQDDPESETPVFSAGLACGLTTSIDRAQDQVIFIREKLRKTPESQVYGSVLLENFKSGLRKDHIIYQPNIEVALIGGHKSFRTVTDKNGIFRFNNIPPDTYVLKTVPPAKYQALYSVQEALEIKRGGTLVIDGGQDAYDRKKFYTSFSLAWNNSFAGRVTEPGGKPLEWYAIRFLPVGKPDLEIPFYSVKNKDGVFMIGNFAPGKYVLAVDVYFPLSDEKLGRFFYPGTRSPNEARVFDLAATSQLKDLEFKLP